VTAECGTLGQGVVPTILRDLQEIEQIADEWRELVATAAATPFESPDWLLPWFQHYAVGSEPCVLTWRSDERLVAIVPLVRWRVGTPAITQLAFWAGAGPAVRGMIDLVTLESCQEGAREAFGDWLRSTQSEWDLLHALRLPADSGMPVRLLDWSRQCGWSLVRLTGVVRSQTWVLDLPSAKGERHSLLGPKARHNLRTEARSFARAGGRYEILTDPSQTAALPAILRRLAFERWGATEINFGPDPTFQPFLEDVFQRMTRAGSMYANVARDASGIRACLVTFVLAGRATAVLIGVATGEDVRRFSLGKHLFDASIGEAIARGCTSYDFLWEGGYKESFWRATPRTLQSIVVGRGVVGRAGATWVTLRRRLIPGLRQWIRARST
jgi:CelD/BcsL family acetyltransferase involved in cellulose biosynthesis